MITIRTEGHGQHIVYHAYHTPRHRLCCSSTVVHHAPRMPHTSPILPIYNLLLHLLRLRKLLKLHPLDNNYCCAATTATTLEPLLQPLLWNYCYSHYFGTTATATTLELLLQLLYSNLPRPSLLPGALLLLYWLTSPWLPHIPVLPALQGAKCANLLMRVRRVACACASEVLEPQT